MSGIIIPTPAYKAVDWITFVTQVEYARRSFFDLYLTNYDNDSEPQIGSSSRIEIEGALFAFASNSAIGGTPSAGTNYIMLEVSGEGASQTVDAVWTTTPPTWFGTRGGWYNATGTKRYVGMCEYDGASAYTEKRVFGGWRRKVREDHVDDDGTINTIKAGCAYEGTVTKNISKIPEWDGTGDGDVHNIFYPYVDISSSYCYAFFTAGVDIPVGAVLTHIRIYATGGGSLWLHTKYVEYNDYAAWVNMPFYNDHLTHAASGWIVLALDSAHTVAEDEVFYVDAQQTARVFRLGFRYTLNIVGY